MNIAYLTDALCQYCVIHRMHVMCIKRVKIIKYFSYMSSKTQCFLYIYSWDQKSAEFVNFTLIRHIVKTIHLVGGSLRDIQMMVGHSSLQTTQRYIESDSESQRKVVNLIWYIWIYDLIWKWKNTSHSNLNLGVEDGY